MALAALWIYAVLLVANPFLHHDLDCHVKSQTHCTACNSSPSAGRTEGASGFCARSLPATGRVEPVACAAADAGAALDTPGRSPPEDTLLT